VPGRIRAYRGVGQRGAGEVVGEEAAEVSDQKSHDQIRPCPALAGVMVIPVVPNGTAVKLMSPPSVATAKLFNRRI
jgi:hypothetical protein